MDRIAIVREAAARFDRGDDQGFVACFAPAVKVYSEPELADRPVVSSRTELAASLEVARARLAGGAVKLAEIEEHDDGIVADLIVLPLRDGDAGAWRLALAVRFAGDAIAEIRPFWQRESAVGALRRFQ
ncbi:MAG: hypothetical protein QOH13_365 [Thermoleophilaceae bacterium]|nr:hypothetical protein [Thermoleophilaceae bacterium]